MKSGEGEASTSKTAEETSKTTKRREPSSEKLTNLSRVTPAQLGHIVFPSESRWQPVRAVSVINASAPNASKKAQRYAGGGGILLLIDKTPGEPITWIEPQNAVTFIPIIQTNSNGIPVSVHETTGDNTEADPPPPFEYPFDNEPKS
jgi:26S proteasome regulatory subunit N2